MDKATELIEKIKQVKGFSDLASTYAYAFGMLSASVSDEQFDKMIRGLDNN